MRQKRRPATLVPIAPVLAPLPPAVQRDERALGHPVASGLAFRHALPRGRRGAMDPPQDPLGEREPLVEGGEQQVALILRVLCGFSVGEIAGAFLGAEAAMEKRIVRATKRI